jgi:hypothetical protein
MDVKRQPLSRVFLWFDSQPGNRGHVLCRTAGRVAVCVRHPLQLVLRALSLSLRASGECPQSRQLLAQLLTIVCLVVVLAGARVSFGVVLRLDSREHPVLAWMGTVRLHHVPRLYGYVRLCFFCMIYTVF